MNPFAFRPFQVTIFTTIVYLALLISLVIVNEAVPSPPSSSTPYTGINLTEAWLDLSTLTQGYHPYNSHKNDEVRTWLLLRIQQILEENEADWQPGHGVTVFNDLMSNVTMSFSGQPGSPVSSVAAYFEGTNVLVYIRGTEDEEGEWWKKRNNRQKLPIGGGGVLVNAHYDSVSTGFGATDDGVGVITVLQLIKYFTTAGNQPKHGIVALLNNGEEDFLYGARAFGNSPLMPFVHTFLNLEGAGAGGRAILFRSTDQQVMSAYSKAPHPFSSVIASDAFSLGAIKSQTDFVVFHDIYGQRGLDLSFFQPRARYHTQDDDRKHTSPASLWHMLSSSVVTMRDLTSRTFVGDRADGDTTKVPNGKGSGGVWFDLFGSSLVLFNLRGMFAWSLTLLIATPLILMLLTYLAQKKGKYYFFSSNVSIYEHPGPNPGDYERVRTGGLKGIIRFPLALIVSGALVFGGAFLLRKVNPFIVHSSKYTVWAMSISLAYFSFWCIMRGADVTRPSALHRGYANIWLFTIGWALLVAVTVLEDRFSIASGYYVVFLQSALFLTTLISVAELFALPDKKTWGQEYRADHEGQVEDEHNISADSIIAPSPGEVDGPDSDEAADDEAERESAPSATTPLLGRPSRGEGESRTTFATRYRRSISALADVTTNQRESGKDSGAFGDEQPWSKSLPTWTWFLQFLILGPFLIILAAQTGLMLTDATNQTAADGSNALTPYLSVSLFSMLLILPLMPFMHRITHHIPLLLLCVFILTLLYNLTAEPFSSTNRYKAFWQQTVNLDTGMSTIKFGGIEEHLRRIIAELPSAAGKTIECHASTTRVGITDCDYDGTDIPPNVANNVVDGIPPQKGYGDLVSLQLARGDEPGHAKLTLDAKNTKSCYLKFAKPIKRFTVAGGLDWDDRFGRMPNSGLNHILLWRRDWDKVWEVDIESAEGLDGNVTCIWSDINTPGTIPALDEAIKFAPAWAVITKFAAGLVEGTKTFKV
ncbi:hypothetical protein M406DRAFT_285744 [Cryphonectria parasitica EP155]|uniref:Peptide hydrolase n=1 Tax=Cryphonectria parasitica (strain ATCC 38755 / EP155) TaxID=660469 RepID=A0A9P4YCG0_CRYP1|nr:uncharacterized protein M406DRAFT_285744 [Cryphonectria parasitica EP155]KAF3770932.1 hypothetical protein M406DRAFT_285744 [Cryphonectria parasitica EP155]